MAWVKLDDNFADHPKIEVLSDAAFRGYVEALCYAARHLTDGWVPTGMVKRIARPKAQQELLAAGLWIRHEDGILVHDFLEYNMAADEVRQKRATNSRRQSLFRDSDLRRSVRDRDGDRCRYCGAVVSWTDRRGPLGGTYDHVDPRGDNSTGNLVVCCRGCNSKKLDRTPAAAGMNLLPEPKFVSKSDLGLLVDAELKRFAPPIPDPNPDPQEPGHSARAVNAP